MNTCTPELLFAADLPQDFYVAGDDLVLDVVNDWLRQQDKKSHQAQTDNDDFDDGDFQVGLESKLFEAILMFFRLQNNKGFSLTMFFCSDPIHR